MNKKDLNYQHSMMLKADASLNFTETRINCLSHHVNTLLWSKFLEENEDEFYITSSNIKYLETPTYNKFFPFRKYSRK